MQMTDSYPLKNQSEAAPNNNMAAKWISNVDVFFESLIRVIRGTRSRSSSGTQGQSVGSGERAGRMFSSTGGKSTWVPILTELFPNIQADAGS